METYYNPEDLAKFSPDGVGEGAPELWDLYMAYYGKVFAEGELARRRSSRWLSLPPCSAPTASTPTPTPAWRWVSPRSR